MKKLIFCKKLIDESKTILIATHLYPDADGIGSQVALTMALREYGKTAHSITQEAIPDRYQYLNIDNIITTIDDFKTDHQECLQENGIDLFIVVDTSSPRRIGKDVQELLERAKKVLYIDHHPAPKAVEAIHCIDSTAAATGQIVSELIENMNVPITRSMAVALYTAILIDTSSFRYPTVSGSTHRVVGKLMDTGINPADAYNNIYGTKRVPHLQLLGNVLANAQTTPSQEIAWLIITKEMLHKHNVNIEDTHAFVNNLLTLNNIKVACMFTEVNGAVKISFRSTGEIDVSAIAQALGGGGHNHSAAIRIQGELEEVIKHTISKVEIMLSSMLEE